MRHVKKIMLALLIAITFVAPLLTTGGTVFMSGNEIIANAKWFGGDYDSLALELVGPTAFADARDDVKNHDGDWFGDGTADTFKSNIKALTSGAHFGNVGLFIGPRGTSKNSDMWSILQSKVTINNDQMEQYNIMAENNQTQGPFSRYKLFGTAIQKLNDRALKSKGAGSSIEHVMLSMTNVATMLTSTVTILYKRYDPAPVVNGIIKYDEIASHVSTNKLCKMVVNNDDARGFFETLGSSTIFPLSGIPNSLVILTILFLIYAGISALMMLINGRHAGEGFRKIIWKFMIALVGIPLFCNLSSTVVGLLNDLSVGENEEIRSDFISKNLDFADWYATGFNLPAGMTLYIDSDNEFVFTQENIRDINRYVHHKVYGTATDGSDDDKIEETIKNYYTIYKSTPMEISFAEPMTHPADGSQPRLWITKSYYKIMNAFGENSDVTAAADSEEAFTNIGYLFENGLNMTPDAANNRWCITAAGKRFGISPIAATNLMRTTFSGSKMSSNDTTTMGSVAFNAYNSVGADTKLPVIIRFLAVMVMLVAAVKGMIKVLAAGFTGMIGGGVKTSLGSSQGFGQLFGGFLAVILSLLTTGMIMTLTISVLSEMYDILQHLFSTVSMATLNGVVDTTGGGLKSAINLFGLRHIPILSDVLFGGWSHVVAFIFSLIILPKLAKVPISVVSEHLAELPTKFAAKAQEIENRFTGDYRAGGGGGSNTMSLISNMTNNAVNNANNQRQAILAGAGMAASSVGGYALGKAGDKLAEKYGTDASMNGESADESDKPESGEAKQASSNSHDNADSNAQGFNPENANEPATGTILEAAANDDNDSEETSTNSTTTSSESSTQATTQIGSDTSPIQTPLGMPVSGNQGASINNSSSDTNVDNGNQISEKSQESIHDVNEGANTTTEQSDQSIQSESMSSAEAAIESNNTEASSMSNESSQTQTMSSASENQTEQATLSETNSFGESDTSVDQHASASIAQSTSQTTVKTGTDTGKTTSSMARQGAGATKAGSVSSSTVVRGGATGVGRSATASASSAGSAKLGDKTGATPTNKTTISNQTSPSAGSAATVSKPTASPQTANKQALTKEQQRAKTMQAIAKGLQAAGNNTTKGQMIAGVMAGATHMAGGMVGAQNITQHGMNAVSNLRSDTRIGSVMKKYNHTSPTPNAPTSEVEEPVQNVNASVNKTVNDANYYAEEIIREQYEDNVRRGYKSNGDE